MVTAEARHRRSRRRRSSPSNSPLTACTVMQPEGVRPSPLHPVDRVHTDTEVAYVARASAVGHGRSGRVRVDRGRLASGRRTRFRCTLSSSSLGLRQRRLGSSAHRGNCLTRSIRLGGRRRSPRSGPQSRRAASMRWAADRRRRLFREPPALATTLSSSDLPPAGHAPRRRQRDVVGAREVEPTIPEGL